MRRIADIYRTKGVNHLINRILDYVNWKSKIMAKGVINWTWNRYGGTQKIEFNEVSAVFDATSSRGGPSIRSQVDLESDLMTDFLSELREGDVVFDIGANVGFHTCFAGNAVGSGEVFAFEPYTENVEQLQRNIKNNELDNVNVFPVPLSDETGDVEFRTPDKSITGHGTGGITLHEGEDTETMDAVRGDDLRLRRGIPTPNVVKLDVEGAEEKVLRGLEDTLASEECRLVYCEIHLQTDSRPSIHDHDESLFSILDLFDQLGFKTGVLTCRGSEIQVKAASK